MPFAIASVLRRQKQNNEPIPPRLTRFKKVTTKMLQHGASDLAATMAAGPRPGKEDNPKVAVEPQKPYQVSSGKFHIVINIGA